jgi:LacI family transcriptional regulator
MKPLSRRPTLRDVAAEAGVSMKTVSRVVNRDAGVSADLTDRVTRAVELLRYTPDERARMLRRTASTPTSIGFTLRDVSNPFFSAILRGLEDVARARDCLVLSASNDGDASRQDILIQTFLERRVSAIAIVPCQDDVGDTFLDSLHGTPVVYLDCEPRTHHADVVRSDHQGGVSTITSLLIEGGHRRIAFLGDAPEIYSAHLRFEGYRSAMGAAGLDIDDALVLRGNRTPSEWYEECVRWLGALRSPPSAIVTGQNFASLGAVRALHRLRLQNRIALAGFDDVDLGDVVTPGVTVYAQQPYEIGRRAGELLFARLDGSTARPTREIVPGVLIQRGSGELPPV